MLPGLAVVAKASLSIFDLAFACLRVYLYRHAL